MLATQLPLVGGRYRILRDLGAGGMADVYEAIHLADQRPVALKVLRALEDPAQRAQAGQLFEQEFMALAQVSHPRIVAAYDFGVDPERGPFYAMELLDGGDLQQRAPVAYREACSIARDVCSALAFLHSRRLVYRDLSARNVRCTASGAAKLIDFGAMMPMGMPLEVVGTPPFVAPEVLQHQPLDERTDLFSLGATLYYALTGQHAFPARSMVQLWELWRMSPPAPGSLVSDIPESLDHLVMQLIQLDPAQRPASAAEVMQRLEALAGRSVSEHPRVQQAYLVAPKLVGRDKEQREASRALSAAMSGSASGLLVLGESGIGRSRFLEECALRAKVQGVITLQVASVDSDDGEYALLRALSKALLHTAPEGASHAAVPSLGVLAKVVPELAQRWPADTSLDALGPNERHDRIQAVACAWFAAVARKRPLCIVVDDARRADPSSIALLGKLLREDANMRLHLIWSLTSAERDAADLPTALLLLERSCEVVTLRPLGASEIEALLSSIFGDVPNLSRLSHYVETTAAGNPRDSLRLLQHLVSERIITHDRGAWNLPAQLLSADLPSSMVHAVAQRLGKLSPSARRLAAAFAGEPGERLSLDECRLLAGDTNDNSAIPDLLQNIEAGLVTKAGTAYRLAQLGFEAVMTAAVSSAEAATQHRRLARVFEARGDELRTAKHLLAAGDHERGLDLLIKASVESQRRTDEDMRRYFDEMRALPRDWVTLYQGAMQLCEELGRPARDKEALLSRLAGFMPIASTARGLEGFAVLRAHLDQLVLQVGLDLYAALPDTMDAGTRIGTALAQAKQRFDQTPPEERIYEPVHAIGPLITTVLASLGLISITNDVEAHRQLPSLAPLVPLAPALWIVQKTAEGVGARIQGRFEAAARIYEGVLERLSRPDRAGLQPAEHTSTMLRVSLSAGTLEACMGIPGAEERARFVGAEPDYETQGLMLRHLCELWQGKLRSAANTKRVVEHHLAFARTRNNYDGQYLLGQILAFALLDDLTGLRHVAESAKRLAVLHPNWVSVVHFCQGELERVRGAPQAALTSLEQALALIGHPTSHQLWANVAAAHVRVLVEIGRIDDAIDHGEAYLRAAEEQELGYLVHYIRIPLSQALCGVDPESAKVMADLAVEGFRAIGSRGLNLVLVLENRARVALDTEGAAAFERYAALSEAENDVLCRRLRHVRRAGPADCLAAGAATPTTEIETDLLKSVLESTTDLGDKMLRIVTLLTRRTAARGAVFYVRQGDSLKRVAWGGEVPHLDALDEWARVYVEGQVSAQDASTSLLDQREETRPAAYGLPAGMYVPRMLGHEGVNGFIYTGLLVLAMPMALDLAWLTPFADRLSRSVLKAN